MVVRSPPGMSTGCLLVVFLMCIMPEPHEVPKQVEAILCASVLGHKVNFEAKGSTKAQSLTAPMHTQPAPMSWQPAYFEESKKA